MVLLKAFSSIKNTGGQDEHLLDCVQNWFSQHEKFNRTQIFEHLEQVARKNHDYACLLGFFYDSAFGTTKNPQEAFKWYLRAAEHNDAFGQNQVGNFFLGGYGTRTDNEKAFYWYQKSADNGCSTAKSNLGYCYENGVHVKKNYRYAFYWYSKSAEMSNELGKYNLAYVFMYGVGTNVDVHRTLKLYLEAKNLVCTDAEEFIFDTNFNAKLSK
ncbi:10103_t:CDS:2 [Ambispora gerdemannii]|uniref:10103_t:CDS:1 n=1 Tax=Ambispora gerdemannii TaxID=144530 RepID=A0A9N9B6X6_9GLOM|nr:10103_t:CDS:2 [Ambispora gerdemannii]